MSLLRISLSNFVLVKHLELEFQSGFTVLTGETGAGKSILIDALQLALGGRADPSVVRVGQSRAEVVAEFDQTALTQQWFAGLEFESTEATLLLRRTVDVQGRSKAWINGAPATATQLRELSALLLDIHGQHAWYGLMRPDSSRALLDDYGRIDSASLQPLWHAWKAAETALGQARTNAANTQAQHDALKWQLNELEKLAPLAGEWSQLQEDHTRLANVQSLLEAAQQALNCISEGDDNALALLAKALQPVVQRQDWDPRLSGIGQTLEQALMLTNEAARELQSYQRHTESDPDRLAQLERRIGAWLALSKRHHCQPEELAVHASQIRDQLLALNAHLDMNALQQKHDETLALFMNMCKEISALRLAKKDELATNITSMMHLLGMKGGAFDVRLTRLDKPQSSGLETVDFLVAGHAGVEPKPVMKIASGGELSRLALAIAVTTSELNGCPTLIFDEVDSGVGGAVAQTVGDLMRQLGKHRQVLAVTHLAQVAACADSHLCVTKTSSADGAISQVQQLEKVEREHEIARMLGGASVTQVALAHAREMIS